MTANIVTGGMLVGILSEIYLDQLAIHPALQAHRVVGRDRAQSGQVHRHVLGDRCRNRYRYGASRGSESLLALRGIGALAAAKGK